MGILMTSSDINRIVNTRMSHYETAGIAAAILAPLVLAAFAPQGLALFIAIAFWSFLALNAAPRRWLRKFAYRRATRDIGNVWGWKQ